MTYQERIKAIKTSAKYHPELTDRELSIMLDATFNEEESASYKRDISLESQNDEFEYGHNVNYTENE